MKKLTAKQEWALEQIKQLQVTENLSAALSAKRSGYPTAHTRQLNPALTTVTLTNR